MQHDQIVAERLQREDLAVGDAPVAAREKVGARAAGVDEGQIGAAAIRCLRRGQLRIGDEVGDRRFAALLLFSPRAGEMTDDALSGGPRRRRVALDERRDLRIDAGRAVSTGTLIAFSASRRWVAGSKLSRTSVIEEAVFAGAGQQAGRAAALQRADIGVVRMAGNDRHDRRIELVENRQDVAGEAVAALLLEIVRNLAALVDEEDDRVRARRL